MRYVNNNIIASITFTTCIYQGPFSAILSALGVEAFSGAIFGRGVGRIWLDNVQCSGSERLLMNCLANSSGINSCTHAQDAGVRCPLGKSMSIMASFFYRHNTFRVY